MIIIAYPCATGGKFIASLVAMIVHGSNNDILQNGSLHNAPNGFVQYHVEDTSNDPDVLEAEWNGFQKFLDTNTNSVIVSHMRNLAQVINTYTDAKIIYLTIATEEWKQLQERNFINKIMRPFWSPRWYNVYRTESDPEFNPDLASMPELVIQKILSINKSYIDTWQYQLPANTDRLLNLDMSCVTDPQSLLSNILAFLAIDLDQDRHTQALNFINEYVKINEYDNR